MNLLIDWKRYMLWNCGDFRNYLTKLYMSTLSCAPHASSLCCVGRFQRSQYTRLEQRLIANVQLNQADYLIYLAKSLFLNLACSTLDKWGIIGHSAMDNFTNFVGGQKMVKFCPRSCWIFLFFLFYQFANFWFLFISRYVLW